MPVHVISDHEMLKRLWRRRALQYPAADLVFKKIDSRHRQETDVVQIGRNGRSELVGSTDPRETDREHRFQTVKRREPEKDSDCGTERDRVRRIRHRDQSHVMLGQPALFSLQERR